MKKDGYIEEFLNSELPIKASLSVSTEYRSYRPFFFIFGELGTFSIDGKIFIIFLWHPLHKNDGKFPYALFLERTWVLNEILRLTFAL